MKSGLLIRRRSGDVELDDWIMGASSSQQSDLRIGSSNEVPFCLISIGWNSDFAPYWAYKVNTTCP